MGEISLIDWVLISAILSFGMLIADHVFLKEIVKRTTGKDVSPFTSIFRIVKLCRSKSKQSNFPDDV